jgi:Glyoxalase/Bleomycin resistance protein/Dioxygenase superfamily
MSTTDLPEQHWTIRSTLVAVADLERAIDFYLELGPFDEIAREGAVSVLGRASPSSVALILRETKGTRHGPQSLGVRSINFSVGTTEELDRIESVLRGHNLFTDRKKLGADATEFVSGRDPDNLPLLFVSYGRSDALNVDYFHMIADLTYSLDT